MTPFEDLITQRDTMEAWRVTLADEIQSDEFAALPSFLRELMGYNHHWLASCIDTLRQRIEFMQRP